MLIAFEGIDGTGKTTLSKEVAKKLGFNYVKFLQYIENKPKQGNLLELLV